MAKKPKKKKDEPKRPEWRLTTEEWAALNTDQVIQKVFGKDGHETLRQEAETIRGPKKDG